MIIVLGDKFFNRGCINIESILTSIKKLLGIQEDYTHFDNDIVMHINSVFFILEQLGVNSGTHFSIEDKEKLWNDYVTPDQNLAVLKSYMYLRVKLIFDPPLSGSLVEVIKAQIAEYEFRIMIEVDSKPLVEEVIDNG